MTFSHTSPTKTAFDKNSPSDITGDYAQTFLCFAQAKKFQDTCKIFQLCDNARTDFYHTVNTHPSFFHQLTTVNCQVGNVIAGDVSYGWRFVTVCEARLGILTFGSIVQPNDAGTRSAKEQVITSDNSLAGKLYRENVTRKTLPGKFSANLAFWYCRWIYRFLSCKPTDWTHVTN